MPLTGRQLAAFVYEHQSKLQCDTQPRALAGPGDPRHVTHPLLAAGWKTLADPSLPSVRLVSPDDTVEVSIEPASNPFAAWWRIGAPISSFGSYWHMSFGGLTPPEILAGVTDALIRPIPDHVTDVQHILTEAGWEDAPSEGTASTAGVAVSADGLLRFERMELTGDTHAWRAEAALHHDGSYDVERVWHAWVSEGTPPHLVAALAHALVDTRPVLRAMHDQLGHYSAVQQPSATTGEQVVAAHEARVAAARAAARRARHSPPLATRPSASPMPANSVSAARSR